MASLFFSFVYYYYFFLHYIYIFLFIEAIRVCGCVDVRTKFKRMMDVIGAIIDHVSSVHFAHAELIHYFKKNALPFN